MMAPPFNAIKPHIYLFVNTLEYGKLWNDNMTVTVDGGKIPLVSYYNFGVAQSLSMSETNSGVSSILNEIARGFEKYVGIPNLRNEFAKFGLVFEKALKTNDMTAIKQVQNFIKSISEYRETFEKEDIKYLILGPQRSFLDEYVKAHNDAIKNPKPQTQQTAPIKVNLGQEVGCCR